MKATLVRGVNTSPYSVKDVDRNELLDVSRAARLRRHEWANRGRGRVPDPQWPALVGDTPAGSAGEP